MSEHENEVSECILAQAARELREATHDIEQGRFEGPVWVLPEISLLEPVKTEVEISDRIHQLNREYMVRVEARLKVSSDMLDQLTWFGKQLTILKLEILIATGYATVLRAFVYADGFDYRYRRFLKDRKQESFEGRSKEAVIRVLGSRATALVRY